MDFLVGYCAIFGSVQSSLAVMCLGIVQAAIHRIFLWS